jgi:predicted nucleic acid-binding protein
MSRGYLLDTDTVSELAKGKRAAPAVLDWSALIAEERLYLSVVTLGEIERGICLAEAEGRYMGTQRRFLEHDLPDRFGERILPFGREAALAWGRLLSKLGRNRESVRVLAIDAQIAATAEVADLIVATRKVRDFERLGVAPIANPFDPHEAVATRLREPPRVD